MFCKHCGTEIADGTPACPKCGKAIEASFAANVPDPANQPALNAPQSAQSEAQASAAPAQTGAAPTQASAAQPVNYNALSKEQYKDAKAAYKAARRASGKSRTPLVVFIIILVLLLAGGSAFAVWYNMDPKLSDLQTENKSLKEQIEKLTAENKELTEKLAEYESGVKEALEADKSNPLLGSWKVSEFENTTEHYACYGGKAKQASVRINITSISSVKGTITADISVVYHGHDRSKLKKDVDSSSEDVVLDFSGVTGQYSDGAFSFELPVDSKYGNNSGVVVTGLMSNSTLSIAVGSYYQSLTNAITDTYIMKN